MEASYWTCNLQDWATELFSWDCVLFLKKRENREVDEDIIKVQVVWLWHSSLGDTATSVGLDGRTLSQRIILDP